MAEIPDSIARQMYRPRDLKGKPRFDELAVLRDVDAKLSENPAYEGLASFGSLFKEYGIYDIGEKGKLSDVDAYALFDMSKASSSSPEREVDKVTLYKRKGIQVPLITIQFNSYEFKPGVIPQNAYEIVAMYGGMIIGDKKKADAMRQTLRIWMTTLSPEQTKAFMDNVRASVKWHEEGAISKYVFRHAAKDIADEISWREAGYEIPDWPIGKHVVFGMARNGNLKAIDAIISVNQQLADTRETLLDRRLSMWKKHILKTYGVTWSSPEGDAD